MSGAMSLLVLLLATSVLGQSTMTTDATTEAAPPDKGTSPDQSSTTVAEVTAETDPMKAEESIIRKYVSATSWTDPESGKGTSPGNALETTPDPNKSEEEEIEIIESLLNDTEKILEDDYKEVIPFSNGDSDADAEDAPADIVDIDDGDDDNDKLSTDAVESYAPNDQTVNRQGDLSSGYDQMGEEEDVADTKQTGDDETIYVSVNDGEPAPLLLTQGGYERPYRRRTRLNGQRMRMRAESASQQAETLETPRGRPLPPQVVPFTQYGFSVGPFFQNPFLAPPGFADGAPQNAQVAPQSGAYFNTPQVGFPDFSPPGFQPAGFQPDGFSGVQRNPGAFPGLVFPPGQAGQSNPGFMFQGPMQVPQSAADPMRQGGFNFFTFPIPGGMSDSGRTTDPFGRPQVSGPYQPPPFTSPATSGSSSPVNLLSRYPDVTDGTGPGPRFPVSYSAPPSRDQGARPDVKIVDVDDVSSVENGGQESNDPPKKANDDGPGVPFGTRIQKPDGPDPNLASAQRDVYIRYPLTEAGYATEESLPVQNTTEKNAGSSSFTNPRPVFPFFDGPRQFPDYSNPDPYRNALNSLQGPATGSDDGSKDAGPDGPSRGVPPFPFSQPLLSRRPPAPLFADRNRAQFYPGPDVTAANQFDVPVFPDTYGFPGSPERAGSAVPACAQKTNSSLCFEDPDYPKRELLFALSSESYLMDRLVAPNQRLDGIDLVDQNTSETLDSPDNYICKSDIKKGLPLRAKNVNGDWKVVVNVERAIGNGKFVQPVRLEICRGANEPCSFTKDVKTSCVQKYSLHRLLSWSQQNGIHTDVYKLPVACSCQIVRE